jgi:hypothetical protein
MAAEQHDDLDEPASIRDFCISLSPTWKSEIDEKSIDLRILLHYPADSKRRSRAILADDNGHNIQDGDLGWSLVGFANLRRDPPPQQP